MKILHYAAALVLVGFIMSMCSSCGTSPAAAVYTAQDLCLQYINSHTVDVGGTISKAQAQADLNTVKSGGVPADCANLPATGAKP